MCSFKLQYGRNNDTSTLSFTTILFSFTVLYLVTFIRAGFLAESKEITPKESISNC
jgi:hypothetical protein